MGDPITIGFLAVSALSAVTSVASISAQADLAEYEAEVARRNQEAAEEQAENILELGELEAEEIERIGERQERAFREDVSGLIGVQRSALAASGIEVDTGTAGEITAQTAQIGEEEAFELRRQTDVAARAARLDAEFAAYDRRIGAVNFGAEAALADASADFAAVESASTVLSTSSSVLGRFLKT